MANDFQITVPVSIPAVQMDIMDILVKTMDFMRGEGFTDEDRQALEDVLKRIKRVKGQRTILGSGTKAMR